MNKSKLFYFVLLVGILVFLDLFTKNLAEKRLVINETEYFKVTNQQDFSYRVNYNEHLENKETLYIKEIVVLKNRFTFLYVRNYNIGFSILLFLEKYLTPSQLSLMIKILQFSILIFILTYFLLKKMKYFLPFSLIIAGGLGNSLDRIYKGYVVDFIKWSFPEIPLAIFNPWPIFNLADIWVTLGGIALFFLFMFEKKPTKLRDYDPNIKRY